MSANKMKRMFLDFFQQKNHRVWPNASLVSDDPTTLFTTAGMQQFKKYYLAPHTAPAPRLVTVQPCLRTKDLEEVGDSSHLTFFEMLGNFSFNDYFKKEAIEYAWEFLTKREWLGIDPKRISVSYFKGDKDIVLDYESLSVIEKIKGIAQIIKGNFEDNFWSLGTEGSPGGPTVEFYIDGIEVWNLVFNEYILENGKYKKSGFKGVDTGMGFERIVAVLENKKDVFETELFAPIIKEFELISQKKYKEYQREFRIIADHIKAAVFALAEGIEPSNKEHGYVVRRLIRRAIVTAYKLGVVRSFTADLTKVVFDIYQKSYPHLLAKEKEILEVIVKEEERFRLTLKNGWQALQKLTNRQKISGKELFDIYQTYGFPLELSLEVIADKGLKVNKDVIKEFNQEFQKHQQVSRASIGKFKGGLVGIGSQEIKYHTATHLLHEALRRILGKHVRQKGSNITSERLRFDFSHPTKLTQEQIKQVEDLVNQQIEKNLPVVMSEMTYDEAKKSGALGFFEHKYKDKVKVYTIGDFSKEICGGPHVSRTGELGRFKIKKEESSSAGVRRIKAVLEDL